MAVSWGAEILKEKPSSAPDILKTHFLVYPQETTQFLTLKY